MDQKEIDRIFYRDGYRLAHRFLYQDLTSLQMYEAVRALYKAMDDLSDAFLNRAAKEGQPLSCKKGCAWCCYQEVFSLTHEFLYLNDFVRKHLTEEEENRVVERAREKAGKTLELSIEEQMKIRTACPFLESDRCMVYEARPMACRIYLSASETSCRKDYENPGDTRNFPGLFDFPLRAGRMMNEGFVAWLKQWGLQVSELPVEQGYSTMVTLGQTMEEWLTSKHN